MRNVQLRLYTNMDMLQTQAALVDRGDEERHPVTAWEGLEENLMEI